MTMLLNNCFGLILSHRLMQLMLVSGHLVQFHIASHRTTHHMRSRVISLSDAYVCSGHFATQSLPIHEFAKTREPLRRRFQDGLESEDLESDTVFLLWYMSSTFSQISFLTAFTGIVPEP